ncbi:MAG: DsbA family protein [Thermomicrobiales bacterium]|jgi:predicted DsbA family dithiol-disulfide isomerase|nr:DsbA family protein [Thermomicrobiales bacterium]
MKQIQMYADLICPFAYLVHCSWRSIRGEYEGQVEIVHRSLALEYVNRAQTPKRGIEAELPILFLSEPDLPYAPWHAPESEWPVTSLPAFEAVHCAHRQSPALGDDMAWAIRVAFFAGSRCISLRHVLIELAGEAGLDPIQFEADFDGGVCKQQVIDDARYGWETASVPGSPTWILPNGELVHDFGLTDMTVDDNWRVTLNTPGLTPSERTRKLASIVDRVIAG